jgi:hypothetical protein
VYQAALKNLEPRLPPMVSDDYYPIRQKINFDDFDFILNIAEIQKDWSTVDKFCRTVGLSLDPERFQEYSRLQAGDDEWYRPRYSNFHPKRYRSTTVGDNTTYTEI